MWKKFWYESSTSEDEFKNFFPNRTFFYYVGLLACSIISGIAGTPIPLLAWLGMILLEILRQLYFLNEGNKK